MPFQAGVKPPNAGKAPANKDRKLPGEVLTPAEVRSILGQCSRRAPSGVRDRALITVLYRAGLRVGESLALLVSDIDTVRGTVRVRHGKGDRARTTSLGDGALAVLQLWIEARKRLGLNGNGKPLFCTLQGGPLNDRQVRAMVKRRAAKAGIERRVHPHGLRHSRAFELSQQGVPVNVIQQMLGHAWLGTTQTYLNHIAPADVIALGRADDWTDD